MLLETQQQPLPPARLGMKRRKGFDLGAHRLPVRFRVNEDATLGMRSEDHGLCPVQQRAAMARGDSDAPFGVERDNRRSMESRPHMACCATFSYLSPLYGHSGRRSSGNF